MKYLVFILMLISYVSYGQTTYYIRSDSTRLTKNGGSNELIIENDTRDSLGVLVNIGKGRTAFQRGRANGDTLFLGRDTIIGGAGGGGSAVDAGVNVSIDSTSLEGRKIIRALSVAITPDQITGNVDNYNPPGLDSASVIRVSADEEGYTITGIDATNAQDGRILILWNIGSEIRLQDNASSSDPENRFLLANGSDVFLYENASIMLQYDAVSEKWREASSRFNYTPTIMQVLDAGNEISDDRDIGVLDGVKFEIRSLGFGGKITIDSAAATISAGNADPPNVEYSEIYVYRSILSFKPFQGNVEFDTLAVATADSSDAKPTIWNSVTKRFEVYPYWPTGTGGGGPIPLSDLLGATAVNEIDNAGNKQSWTWTDFTDTAFVKRGVLDGSGTQDILEHSELQGESSNVTIAKSVINRVEGTENTNYGIMIEARDGGKNIALAAKEGQSVFGGDDPHASALVDFQSTTQGVGLPNMTAAQRAAISSPKSGLTVYDTDSTAIAYYNGSSWVFVKSGGTSGGSSGITVGTTTITSGTNARVLFDDSGVVGEYTISGTGSVAMTASPTFTGTPAAPTASAGTSTTQLATTAFATNAGMPQDIIVNNALGGNWKATVTGIDLQNCSAASNLSDGAARYMPVYLAQGQTITGVTVFVRTQGSYTGDNNNKVALYSYSGGTMTKVAESTNNSSLWTGTANAFQNIAFSSTYSASPGLYFIGFLYNNSTQTTAPALAGQTIPQAAMGEQGFSNSAKLYTAILAQNDLPSTQAMSGVASQTSTIWAALY